MKKIKKALSLLKKILINKTFRSRVFYYISRRYTKVQNKTILYESYHGKSMTGNPYAMYLYMLDDKRFESYTHIWILEDPRHTKEQKNTKLIKRNSLKNAYYLLASKYLINNTTFLPFVQKREEQIYINTWHGTPLKTLGKDIKFSYGNARNVCKNLLQTDYFISPNKYTTDIFLRSNDIDSLFPGKIIENGYPRNDLLFSDEAKTLSLKETLSLDKSKKTILYAPTFRGSHLESESDDQTFIDFIVSLNKNFSDTYNILTKLHHIDHKNIIDLQSVPGTVDTNELLCIIDILITDYSSISFDFVPLKRPIIYYTFDLDKYGQDRGFYFDLNEMPGAVCRSKDSVIHEIENIDLFMQNNITNYEKAIEKFCKYEDGNVTQQIIDAIFFNKTKKINMYEIEQNNKKSILLYGGSFLNNGITSSLVGLLSNISYANYDVYLIANTNLKGIPLKRIIGRIPNEVKIIYLADTGTKIFNKFKKIISDKQYVKLFKEENYSFFGNTKFDIAIDYSGYKMYWAGLIAYANAKKRYIYLHSDMRAESQKRSHLLEFDQIYRLYENRFDKLITVSDSSYYANKSALPELHKKIAVVHNPINGAHIINLSEQKEVLDEVDFSENKINFITIGRYSIEKGHDNLIKAFSELCKNHNNLHLYIVGHGPLHKKLGILIQDLHMKDYITLTGNIENPFPLLKECNCFVLSSHYEGQGLVLLEALILGIPCISTDIPGPRSILSDDQGLLVENNIDGLTRGMEKFLHNKIPYKPFEYKKYTDNAMNEFTNNVY